MPSAVSVVRQMGIVAEPVIAIDPVAELDVSTVYVPTPPLPVSVSTAEIRVLAVMPVPVTRVPYEPMRLSPSPGSNIGLPLATAVTVRVVPVIEPVHDHGWVACWVPVSVVFDDRVPVTLVL